MKRLNHSISHSEKRGTRVRNAVRRIPVEHTDRGLLSKVTSHNNATVGSGIIVNQVALSYNAFNQLAEDAQSHSGAVAGSTPKVSYIYANGTGNTTRRLTVTYPSNKVVNMSYGTTNSADDRLSRLAGVSLTGDPSPLGQFAWMGAGRLVSLTMPQPGIALSYKQAAGQPVGDAGDPYSGYDRFGRTVDMRWIKTSDSSSLSRIQYGYDRMNRRLWRQDLAAPAATQQDRFYSYDPLGQVTDSALGNLNINRTAIAGIPAQREAFDYDAIGNWKDYLRQTEGTTTLDQKRTHNRDNQLTELNANASGLSYDAAGNMTACRPDKDGDWSKGYTMVWDAWSRLVVVRNAQTSATVASYAYDGLTRRLTTTISGTVRRFFYNDVWKCVEERLNASSNAERVYYWSTREGHRDELLRRDRDTDNNGSLNETLWCLMDYFDPIAVANAAGVIQERYTYTAFGLASILTGVFAPRANSNFAWNFLFHGQFRDAETGWGNYGFRYYLPWLGRWPSRDPIGERGGENLYDMIGNSLLNQHDHLGLKADCCPPPKVRARDGRCCKEIRIDPKTGRERCIVATVGEKKPFSWHRGRNRKNCCPRQRPTQSAGEGLVVDSRNQKWVDEPPNSLHGNYDCYRATETGMIGGSQCCYRQDGRLVNEGPEQGTYDYVRPYTDSGNVNPVGLIGHVLVDVIPHLLNRNIRYDPTPEECTY